MEMRKNQVNNIFLFLLNRIVFSISLWCLHPGVGFEFIKSREPRNVLLTSGTLAPLKSFESELTLEFPIKLENGHVIDTKAQVKFLFV